MNHDAVGEHLVSSAEFEQVVHHHEFSANFRDLAISPDSSERLVDDGESIKGSLCREFLDHSDEQVENESPPEQRILPITDDEDEEKTRTDYSVEEVEEVAAKDVG